MNKEMLDQIDALIRENARFLEALKACAAPFDSGPCTVVQGYGLLAHEFQRRMDIAAKALEP